MNRKLFFCLCLMLVPAAMAVAADKQTEPKELSGMSIVGNDEAPKSLYIVPWKSSEIGVETSLNRTFNGSASPVDREVFLRQLAFHEVSTEESGSRMSSRRLDRSDVVVSSGF